MPLSALIVTEETVWNPDESFIYDLKKGTSREPKKLEVT